METHVILITAGGTGGHVLPAVVVAEEVLARKGEVVFVTDPRGKAYIPENFKGQTFCLPLPVSIGGLKSRMSLGWGLLKSLQEVRSLLKNHKVQKIIGFGGYPSFPVLFLGVFYRIPFILHEQNAILGRVNRWFGRWAQAIGISTSRVRPLTPILKPKIHQTGMPVRPSIQALRKELYETPDPQKGPLHLAVLGGSQGSESFSQIVPEALALLPGALQKRLRVVQQCRPNVLEETRKRYEKLGVEARLAPFFEDIPQILKKSHMVIARAGASTIAELTWAQRPAILIPYPWAMDDHQKANAEEIERVGGGWTLFESEKISKELAKKIESLITQPQALLFAAERLRILCSLRAEKALVDMVWTSNA